jgi:chromosome segregation ATPase
VTRAREEAAKAREALVSLSACVKELEEDVTLVSRHRDILNIQIRQVTARFEALKNKVAMLSGAVRERDEALSNASQEIETLRAAIRDRDGALQALEKTCGGLHDEVVGWQTHSEGKFLSYSGLGGELPSLCSLDVCVPELEKEQPVAQATATSF